MSPTRRPWLRRIVLALCACAALAGCAALDVKQSEWIFRPVKEDWRGLAGAPAGVEELWLTLPGGKERLHAWWAPREGAPVLLYLHGARWNLSGSSFRIERWRAMGFAVLAIDYRGFGRSDGERPSEAQAYEDARVAWQWLAARVPEPARRFIYGHSLGGAIAIDLAAQLPSDAAGGLIVESTFTSIRDVVAASDYGWLPVGLFITQRFEAEEKMRRVRLPTLIMHGTADRVIPHEMADRLYAAAPGPKRLAKFEGANHSGSAWRAAEAYAQAVREFVVFAAATRNAAR
ncbi:MAG: alpha/beta fold hydrolase [Burkholderiales bacterium]|nr:alpha/beta fold hydrolase [Burkholderiales bacterium]